MTDPDGDGETIYEVLGETLQQREAESNHRLDVHFMEMFILRCQEMRGCQMSDVSKRDSIVGRRDAKRWGRL